MSDGSFKSLLSVGSYSDTIIRQAHVHHVIPAFGQCLPGNQAKAGRK